MSKKRMTIGKKMALGFGIVLIFSVVLASLSYRGVGGIVQNAAEVIKGNELEGILAQKEVDHLNWAAKVNAFLTDLQATKLGVEVDDHKCGFGKWLYGEQRQKAEKLLPSLAPLLKEIEAPHHALHRSAIEINKVAKKEHPGLLLTLYQRLNDHINWVSHVSGALAVRAAGGGGADFTLGVQTDPNKCAFGHFLNDPQTAKLCAAFPELKAALDASRAPHQKLHQSAIKIEKKVKAGAMQEAMAIYQGEMQEALKEVKTHLSQAIQAERQYRQAAAQANTIYNSQTVPSLEKVQALLHRIRKTAKQQIMTDAGMLSAAMDTKRNVTVVGLLAVISGVLLSFFIGRGIIRVMKGTSAQMGEAAEQAAAASIQVSSSSQSLAQGASQQAASLEETTASLQQMSSMTRSNAENAQQADMLMGEAARVVDLANSSMGDLTKSMKEVSAASEETAKIIKTIDEIAFQTNLLALNAAVEAARAGEAGAGFAVVAEEVRNLAMRAADAAKNTANLIEGTVAKVKEGSAVVAKTAEAFTQMAESTVKVKELVAEIAAASNEQAQGVDQINKAVEEMNTVTQQVAANAEESASASEELNAQSEQMKGVVGELVALVGGHGNGSANGHNGNGVRKMLRGGKLAGRRPVLQKIPSEPKGREISPEQIIPLEDEQFKSF
jgi:methyl-accepting chemotaxis protein